MEEKRYKVLIVDDEPANLTALQKTLGAQYDVTPADSPEQALEILKSQYFELIVSDHKVPDMDGIEFLRQTSEISPHTIRLLVTAYTDAKILIDAINYAKIYRYVKKPCPPGELLYVIKASLEYYQLKMDNEALIKDLKELFTGTMRAIIEALDAKDSFTYGRSRRVALYARKMFEALGAPSIEIGKIELAGLLHDIGMIGVSEEILNKTEKLTAEEYEEIKKHVEYSMLILGDIKQLGDVVKMIKYHHEHFDGTGYPFGLKGKEIPIGARVIAIADAFDGMISNRAFRDALSAEQAWKTIVSRAGTQFDPNLIKVFGKIALPALKEIKQFEVKEKQEKAAQANG
jgi:response regulator RpfG family c-di-GMP phosphodiesterase